MGSISENAGEVIRIIKDFFNDMGGSCAELLSSALGLYKKMLLSAVSLLSKDYQGTSQTISYSGTPTITIYDRGDFSGFWTVINNVSNIFAAIATTLITLLFLISLVNDSWDNRHELDFASFFKSFAKFFAAVVLVNNATKIVSTLFTLSSKVAALVCSTNNLNDLDVSLSVVDETLIKNGVSGPKGLIISILFLIVFLVIVASGITVMLEVYQRMFKIFVLIPFSAISFSTFTMSDSHRGAEVFHGYVKSIVSTAIESVIIMVFIAFSLTLINGDGLNAVFTTDTDIMYETYTCSTQNDVLYLRYCKNAKNFTDDQISVIRAAETNDVQDYFKSKSDSGVKVTTGVVKLALSSYLGPIGFTVSQISGANDLTDAVNEESDANEEIDRSFSSLRKFMTTDGAISDTLSSQLSNHSSTVTSIQNSITKNNNLSDSEILEKYRNKGVVKDSNVSSVYIGSVEIDDIDIDTISVSENSPLTVYVYGQIGFFDILTIVFKYLFPCLLCGSAVKMAGQISGMILGR